MWAGYLPNDDRVNICISISGLTCCHKGPTIDWFKLTRKKILFINLCNFVFVRPAVWTTIFLFCNLEQCIPFFNKYPNCWHKALQKLLKKYLSLQRLKQLEPHHCRDVVLSFCAWLHVCLSVHSPLLAGQILERIATEFNQLQFHAVQSKGMPLLDKVRPVSVNGSISQTADKPIVTQLVNQFICLAALLSIHQFCNYLTKIISSCAALLCQGLLTYRKIISAAICTVYTENISFHTDQWFTWSMCLLDYTPVTVYVTRFCPLPAYRRDHLHAAAVSWGPADRGAANNQCGHSTSLPEDIRHHRQDSRCWGPGRTGAGQTIHGPGKHAIHVVIYYRSKGISAFLQTLISNFTRTSSPFLSFF